MHGNVNANISEIGQEREGGEVIHNVSPHHHDLLY